MLRLAVLLAVAFMCLATVDAAKLRADTAAEAAEPSSPSFVMPSAFPTPHFSQFLPPYESFNPYYPLPTVSYVGPKKQPYRQWAPYYYYGGPVAWGQGPHSFQEVPPSARSPAEVQDVSSYPYPRLLGKEQLYPAMGTPISQFLAPGGDAAPAEAPPAEAPPAAFIEVSEKTSKQMHKYGFAAVPESTFRDNYDHYREMKQHQRNQKQLFEKKEADWSNKFDKLRQQLKAYHAEQKEKLQLKGYIPFSYEHKSDEGSSLLEQSSMDGHANYADADKEILEFQV